MCLGYSQKVLGDDSYKWNAQTQGPNEWIAINKTSLTSLQVCFFLRRYLLLTSLNLACSLCYPSTTLTQMLHNEELCHLQCPVDGKQLDQYFDGRTQWYNHIGVFWWKLWKKVSLTFSLTWWNCKWCEPRTTGIFYNVVIQVRVRLNPNKVVFGIF